MTSPTPFIIRIDKIVPGGYGLGRLPDGMVVLVRQVVPGELVRIRPLARKKHHLFAELLEVLEASTDRIAPRCSAYGRCGGCDLQHMTPAAQLRLKCAALEENLLRTNLPEETIALLPPLAAPDHFGYRQRIRLHADTSNRLGYHRFQSHEVEPISHCPLARPEINKVLGCLQALPAHARLLQQSTTLELFFNPDRATVALLLHFQRKPRPADLAAAKEVANSCPELDPILFTVAGQGIFDRKGRQPAPGEHQLSFTLPAAVTGTTPLVLSWEVGGFCQVNLQQNENLLRTVLAWARVGAADRVLDLYCGMGNFALPLSLHAGEVTGLDGQGAAIRSAARNALQAGRPNCRFTKVPVPAGLRQLLTAGRTFDLVLLDPPRQGAAEIIPLLPGLGAKRLLMISCDPATLARDLNGLRQQGFTIQALLPIDMFPSTHHLETLTLLER